jgi:hypothetical protein
MPDLTRDLTETQSGRYRCPWCDARRGLAFDPDQGDSGVWHCFSCQRGGDGVELYTELRNADLADALGAFGIDRSGYSSEAKKKERRAPKPTLPKYNDAEWKERCRVWKAMTVEEIRLRTAYKQKRTEAREARDRDAFDHWQQKIDDLREHVLHRERAGHEKAQRLDANTQHID